MTTTEDNIIIDYNLQKKKQQKKNLDNINQI